LRKVFKVTSDFGQRKIGAEKEENGWKVSEFSVKHVLKRCPVFNDLLKKVLEM